MRKLRGWTITALALVVWTLAVAAAQQRPTRLLVENNTTSVVTISARGPRGWEYRGRVNVRSSLPIYNVNNGDQFEAAWRGGRQERTVRLRHNREYGGLQDLWVVN